MDNLLSLDRFHEALDKKGWTLTRLADEYDQRYSNANGKSVYKTLLSWHCGKIGNPTLKILVRVCDLLECDIDYLLGRMDEHTHINKIIHDQTGLAESSIEKLKELKLYAGSHCVIALDFLLSLGTFTYGFLDDLYEYYNLERDLYDELEKDSQIDFSSFPDYENIVAAGIDPRSVFGNPYLKDAKDRVDQAEFRLNKTLIQILEQFEHAAESNSAPQLNSENRYKKK